MMNTLVHGCRCFEIDGPKIDIDKIKEGKVIVFYLGDGRRVMMIIDMILLGTDSYPYTLFGPMCFSTQMHDMRLGMILYDTLTSQGYLKSYTDVIPRD